MVGSRLPRGRRARSYLVRGSAAGGCGAGGGAPCDPWMLPGVFTNTLQIERPRAGNGAPFVETFTFPYVLPADFFTLRDPAGKSGLFQLSACLKTSEPVRTLSGYNRSPHPLTSFLDREHLNGAILWVARDAQFVGNGTDEPSLTSQGSSIFVPGTLVLWGNVTLGSADVGNASAYSSSASRRTTASRSAIGWP